jgi:hypothetical protein
VVEGGLAAAGHRVDPHEPRARAVADRVPEAGASIDPLRTDLVADHELAGANGPAEEELRSLIVLRGAHAASPCALRSGMVIPEGTRFETSGRRRVADPDRGEA